MTLIRIIIMHELLLRKYGTNFSRIILFKGCEKKFWTGTITSWYQLYVNLLLGEWVGLNLTYFFELFLCELLRYWSSLPVPATLPYYFYNSHSYWKQNFFKDSISQRCILLLFIIIYIIITISTTMITTLTLQLITNKNQFFLFYLFSENTTRRPWHWITNRAQQDQPYSNESLEIQTHNHLLKDNSHQSEVLCGNYGNQKKILRFFWNFGMSADITLAGHRLGKLRKLIPKFTPPEGRGHTLTYETLTYQYQLLCKFC